eukprot:4458836-Prymnesium_polylepis.1
MQMLESCAKHRVDCLAHVRSLSEQPCAQGEACAAGSTHRKGEAGSRQVLTKPQMQRLRSAAAPPASLNSALWPSSAL